MTVLLRRKNLGRTSCRGISEKSQEGITTVRNDKPFPEGHDLVIRWGCTSNAPVRNVLNTAKAIHEVADKVGFRMKLLPEDLCPGTWRDPAEAREAVGDGVSLVFRPNTHSRGRHCYTSSTLEDDARILECVRRLQKGVYAQEEVQKSKEFRVFVVQGRAIAVVEKIPGNPNDLAWNVAQGAVFENVRWDNWPLRAVRVALEAFSLSSLDFGGVDVMVDTQGKPYVLEINSAPSLTSEYRQQCFAKAFDYIVRHGKERIPLIPERGGYLKFIHPAITERAQLCAV